MDQGLIPRRYAKAIYQVAQQRGHDNRLYQLMQQLEATFADSPELASTVANPFVADTDKIALLTTAAGATPDDTTFADTLRLLAENRRLDMTRLIARAYCDIYRSRNRISLVTVTSAAPLPQHTLDRISKLITDHLNGGTMELTTRVDPSLIGGFTIQVGGERLDASVRNSLEQLRLKLIN